MKHVGDSFEIDIQMSAPSSVIAVYVTGPVGAGSTQARYLYPCPEITLVDDNAYRFKSSPIKLPGEYYVETRSDFGVESDWEIVAPVASGLLVEDL